MDIQSNRISHFKNIFLIFSVKHKYYKKKQRSTRNIHMKKTETIHSTRPSRRALNSMRL